MTVTAAVAELVDIHALAAPARYAVRLRTGTRFALEMAYCAPRGIPHSRFLAWDEDDQDKALGWMLHERARCSGCGTFRDEWLDDKGRTVPDPPYIAEAVHCYGCSEKDAVERELRASTRDTDGIYVRLRPFDPDRDDEDG